MRGNFLTEVNKRKITFSKDLVYFSVHMTSSETSPFIFIKTIDPYIRCKQRSGKSF